MEDTSPVQCPHCGTSLRIPTASIARSIQCPSCQKIFTVGSGGQNLPSAPEGLAAPPNPYAAIDGPATQSFAPYKSAAIQSPPAEVWTGTGWRAFVQSWPMIVAGYLIVMFAGILFAIIPVIGFLVLNSDKLNNPQAFQELQASPAFVAFSLLNSVVSTFFLAGYSKFLLEVIRGRGATFGMIFSQFRAWASIVPIWLPLFTLSAVSNLFQQTPVISLALSGLSLVLSLAYFFLLWPSYFVASDQSLGPIATARQSVSICVNNPLNSVILLMIGLGSTLAGFCLCCVGLVPAIALVMTIAATLYCLCRGEMIPNPTPQ
jgi:uncharacterized membrane protein